VDAQALSIDRRRALGALAGVALVALAPAPRRADAHAASSAVASAVAGAPKPAGHWAWTDQALWFVAPDGRAHGPWPRYPEDGAPRAVAGGLWRVQRQGPSRGLSFLAVPADPAQPPAEHWRRDWPAADAHGAGARSTPLPVWTASADGRWAAVSAGDSLHLLDRLGGDSLVLPGRDLAGRALGAVRALAALDARRSLLVDWTDGGQWWELSLDPQAAPVYDGLVHDWRLGEGLPRPGYRQPRRLPLAAPERPPPRLRVAFPQRPFALADDDGRALVVHLDVRRVVLAWTLQPDALAPDAVWRTRLGDGRLTLAAGSSTWRLDTGRWRVEPAGGAGAAEDAAEPFEPELSAPPGGWPRAGEGWRGWCLQPG
jgi:hypothetical protein